MPRRYGTKVPQFVTNGPPWPVALLAVPLFGEPVHTIENVERLARLALASAVTRRLSCGRREKALLEHFLDGRSRCFR